MPRSRRASARKAVYWWSEHLATLRAACTRSRRVYTRSRRLSRRDQQNEASLYLAYQEAKKVLRAAMAEAKDAARIEMLEGLDADPWGRPYRAARNKLRPIGPPLTESLEENLLVEVVRTLFPIRSEFTPPTMDPPLNPGFLTEDFPPVTAEELNVAALCLRGKKTAPGPDGVPGKVLGVALKHMAEQIRGLFERCFSVGKFPRSWKEGQLVLLRKGGRPVDSPSGYRPIVLLDEAGKLFERVVASRLNEHLGSVGPDLADSQFGFRAGRSTIDALSRLKRLTFQAGENGEVVVAVSFDISNAFNSIPHSTILEGLRYHRVPLYLRVLIADYLAGREVLFVASSGDLRRFPVETGVPQGSVLGPLLWNLGYNWLLRGALLRGTEVLCYADDTLLTARGRDFREAVRRATAGSSLIIERICSLGLKVALEKTEAIYFHGPRRRPPAGTNVVVGGFPVPIKTQMKYLGLILDSRWQFGPHFRALSPRLLKAADSLGWLLPNLGGPNAKCRRLYAGILRSMALYGAPIWADTLHREENLILIRRPQRAIAQRVGRAYRTVSFAAACAVASTPPWELEAGVLSAVYDWTAEQRARDERPHPQEREAVRAEARRSLVRQWANDLAGADFGRRTLDAIGPVLEGWLERPQGFFLTYRMVQVLTGHGCFGSYLYRIRRELSPMCHHCRIVEDTPEHTLAVCPAWAVRRRDLEAEVGHDLSLPNIVYKMLGSEAAWRSMASFCEEVISQKEAAEREREADPYAPLLRRGRRGRRRRQFNLQNPPDGGQPAIGVGTPSPALHRPSFSSDRGGQVLPAAPADPTDGGHIGAHD